MSRRLLLVYFASGLGAVAVETIWMRWLREVLGATAPAASATLVAFFVGHAAGALWATRRTAAITRPLALYGRLELAAAAGALFVPIGLALGERLLALGYDALREVPAALTAVRFAIALVASFPAAFCFGATFPVIASAATARARELGARGGALYAVNTLGAVAGTAMAAFLLPGAIGVRATYAVAVACLVAAGLAALQMDEATKGDGPRRELPRAGEEKGDGPRRELFVLAAGAGFGAFALQVLLVQAFAQVSNQSIHAFGAVLIAVLVAISAAGATVAALARRIAASHVLAVATTAAALALAAFPAWLAWWTDSFAYVGGSGGGLAYFAALLGAVFATAGVPLFAVSLVFPATFATAGAGANAAPIGPLLGRLVAANTIGAIAGALAAPYVLIPAAGLWAAFAALSVLYGVAAVLLPAPRRWLRDAALAIGWVAIVGAASPLAVPPFALAPGERAIAVESTPAAVIAVVERDGERLIRIDNHYALGGTAERVHHERQAHLPLVLAPHAKRVAYAGSATGISAGGALAHPIESLHLVELVPGVARAASTFFGDANRGVYRDPRTRVVLDDARNFLRLTSERFDVVVADLFVPWQAGAGSLYTREHFEAVRERLLPGGLFCQWLPLYQLGEPELRAIAATFLDVFPTAAVVRGDFFGRFPIAALVGWADEPAETGAIEAATQRLAAAGVTDRWVIDPVGPWALYVAPLGPFAPALADAPRNTDDRPFVERAAAATHAGGTRGKLDPIVGARWITFTEKLRAAARDGGDPLWPTRGFDARRAIDGGAALQLAGAYYVAGEMEAAARAFARAADLLPARLVAEAPADATAAELWSDE